MDDRASDSGNQSTSNTVDDVVCRSARTYSKTAIDERRIRIVDIVPVYLVHVTLIYAAIVLCVAVLLAMHHYGANIVRWADLTRVDSLGTYLSAGSLFVGALLAFLTYRIRRHRLDDYRGRYRCWLWFAGLLLFASLDCMLNFRTDVARGLEAVTRVRLLGQTDGWWIVVWCVAYGSMTLRALIEVRESVGTIVVGVISAALLFTGMALQMDLLLLPSSVPIGLALHAAQLLGVGLLLATLVQYSRFVWLDAQGLISRRIRRVEEDDADETKPQKSSRRTGAVAKKPAVKPTAQQATDEDEEEAKPRRGWFSFGKKKSEETEEENTKPVRKPTKPAAKSTDEEETTDEKPRRGWFSFGKTKSGETDEEPAKPVKKPAKPVAKSTDEGELTEQQPWRGWFSFGKKNTEDEPAEQPAKAPPKPKIAASTVKDEDAAEKPKRSWFSWGKKSSDEADQDEAASAGEERTTMTPRVKTRPKSQPAPQERPAANQGPTITGKYSQDDDGYSDNSDEDEEILRLEAKPDHLLSKAERRRLKKLKRRSAA
ncbi:hypothetical protein C5Y96_00710 [Blastopirellula marina]|uniref:Uncharacterized protein n=2 Tax=Pirellulales TaxID=2691354 RepID=A0A2S8G9X6_9BACT|nr:hypothetical protein C5Y96_00710 [Blastopirellula marina]RCS56290.1 hypothetical protein DTL36_00710 [Bremerella cremea]